MSARPPVFLTAWILWCAYWVVAGWVLSAVHELTTGGYIVALLAGAALLGRFVPRIIRQGSVRPMTRWRRYLRPLPFLFALITILSLVGGLLYAPNNYDALSYRLPRLLHWLANGSWHWISTPNQRMNIAAANTEWLLAPLLAITRSDRLGFGISCVSFLLLPGLIFSTLRHAGVALRVAWQWMWLLPAGYGFVLQAASLGNDLLSVVFLLATINYALLARRSGRRGYAGLSLLAAALLSGTKATNLPLLLPCLVALGPALLLWRRNLVGAFGIGLIALTVSFLPTALFNQRYAGHWGGDPNNDFQVQLHNPFAGLLGNGLQLLAQNASPPLLPSARQIQAEINHCLPYRWVDLLKRDFPRFDLRLGELPQEESAGLGLGVVLALSVSAGTAIVGGWRRRRRSGMDDGRRSHARWIALAAWGALAFYMAKMGSEATARLVLPYYVLLPLPWLVGAGQDRRGRSRSWRVLAILTTASSLIGLVLSPSRPIWPALRVTSNLVAQHPASPQMKRMRDVYVVYAQRHDMLAPLRRHLPETTTRVGLICSEDDSELSLWMPYGQRRVEHLVGAGPEGGPPIPKVEWVVAKTAVLKANWSVSPEEWAGRFGGRVVARENIVAKASVGPEEWLVIQVQTRESPAR